MGSGRQGSVRRIDLFRSSGDKGRLSEFAPLNNEKAVIQERRELDAYASSAMYEKSRFIKR